MVRKLVQKMVKNLVKSLVKKSARNRPTEASGVGRASGQLKTTQFSYNSTELNWVTTQLRQYSIRLQLKSTHGDNSTGYQLNWWQIQFVTYSTQLQVNFDSSQFKGVARLNCILSRINIRSNLGLGLTIYCIKVLSILNNYLS